MVFVDQYNQTDVDSYPSSDFRTNSIIDNGIRQVTLQKMNDNQSFGFVIISSQNKAGATVGKYTNLKRNIGVLGFLILFIQTDNNRHEQTEHSVIHKVWIG